LQIGRAFSIKEMADRVETAFSWHQKRSPSGYNAIRSEILSDEELNQDLSMDKADIVRRLATKPNEVWSNG